MRFYGIDPERLLTYPPWLVVVLYEQLTKVSAKEMLSGIAVVMAPHIEAKPRQRMIDRLERLLPDKMPAQAPRKRTRRDPAKAREYFEQLGAIVE